VVLLVEDELVRTVNRRSAVAVLMAGARSDRLIHRLILITNVGNGQK
jgi:hypothetical protein